MATNSESQHTELSLPRGRVGGRWETTVRQLWKAADTARTIIDNI